MLLKILLIIYMYEFSVSNAEQLQVHINLRGQLSVKIDQIKLELCEILIFVQNIIDQWGKVKAFQSLFIATSSFGFLLIRQITNWSGKGQFYAKIQENHIRCTLVGQSLTQRDRQKRQIHGNFYHYSRISSSFHLFIKVVSILQIHPFNVLGGHFQHLQGKICYFWTFSAFK